MTIPGKGGRPRKWKSDADRVRAYRARQRGEEEPPTVDVALAAGDEAAAAWERVRELGVELSEQVETAKQLRDDLRTAHRRLDEQQRRFEWLQGENERLRSRVDSLVTELETARAATTRKPGTAMQQGDHPNRQQRRRAERRNRRRPPA